MAVIDAFSGKTGNPDAPPEGQAGAKADISPLNALLALKQQVLLEKEIKSLHEDENSGKKGNNEESLAATIVKSALETNRDATNQYQRLAERNDVAAQQARKETQEAISQTNTIIASQINGAMDRLEKIREEIKSGSGEKPKNTVQEIKDVLDLINTLRGAEKPPQAPAPTSIQYEMQLQQMKNDHDLAMKKLDADIARMNTELSIRLAEFEENKANKKREFEENSKFKGNALSAVGDIAATVLAGFKGKIPGVGAAEVATNPGAAPNTEVEKIPNVGANANKPTISKFTCENCGDTVQIPPDAGEKVTCTQCGTEYLLQRQNDGK